MLDRVSSIVLGLNGKGGAETFADYAQWEAWQAQSTKAEAATSAATVRTPGGSTPAAPAKKKLSYLEAREFAAIEERVEASDARLAAARNRVEDPAIATNSIALQEALKELEAAQQQNDLL